MLLKIRSKTYSGEDTEGGLLNRFYEIIDDSQTYKFFQIFN